MLSILDIVRRLATDPRCSAVIICGTSPTPILPLLNVLTTPFEVRIKLRFNEFPTIFREEADRTHVSTFQTVYSARERLRSGCRSQTSQKPEPENRADIRISTESQVYKNEGRGTEPWARSPRDSTHSDEEILDTIDVYKQNRRVNSSNLRMGQAMSPDLMTESQIHSSPAYQAHGGASPLSAIVPRDTEGRRLDLPLNFLDSLVDEMDKIHYCNSFHLKGHCPYPKCKHLHMVRDEATQLLRRLNPGETETLRFIARRSPCRHGTACNVVDCWAGHRCINHIKKGKRDCSFPESMHFEDKGAINMP